MYIKIINFPFKLKVLAPCLLGIQEEYIFSDHVKFNAWIIKNQNDTTYVLQFSKTEDNNNIVQVF